MAKHQKRRRRRSPVKALKIDHQLGVGAPINGAVSSTVLANTVVDKLWLMSMTNQIALRDNTPGEGPLYLGVCHSDYSDAEIFEWFMSQGSWDEGDLVAVEQSKRKCRIIGMFPGLLADELIEDGAASKTKLGWTVADGDTLNFFTINEGGATRTTGGIVEIKGFAWAKNA